MQMRLVVGDWADDPEGEGPGTQVFEVEIPEPPLSEDDIIRAYEVEGSEERKRLDYWAQKYVFSVVRTGPRVAISDGQEWISVYFAGPEEFALFDCEYNFDYATGRAIG